VSETIQQYDIVEKIGEGGMGVVYKALHRTLERPVAIKRLAAHLSKNQNMLQRFLKEAKLQAKLTHPNVVNIFDLLEWEGEVYLVMEYVPGPSVKELLQEKGRLAPAEALRIAAGVLAGLVFMHENGIVHRDIKPSNIIVPESGVAKVTDFGIARLVADDSGLTRFGAGVGTLQYMAPELLKTGEVSFGVDIYSMGVTLYEMLSGHAPFTGNTDLEIMLGHIEKAPPPLELPEDEAGRACAGMVLKALAKDPAERFASAKEFQAEVRRIGLELLKGTPGAVLFAPGTATGEVRLAPRGEATAAGEARPATRTDVPAEAPPTMPGDTPLPELPKPMPPKAGGLAVGLALAALVLGAGGYFFLAGTSGPEPVSAPQTRKAPAPEAPPAPTPAAPAVAVPAAPEATPTPTPAPAPEKAPAPGASAPAEPAPPAGKVPAPEQAAAAPAASAAPSAPSVAAEPAAQPQAAEKAPAAPARELYVQSKGLRLREAPDASARALGALDVNTKISALESQGDWTRVSTPQGQTGWVSSAQLGENPAPAQAAPAQAAQPAPEKAPTKKPAKGGDAGWRIIK